jgi:ribosomal protein S18 acetylase RimI-like enzyme
MMSIGSSHEPSLMIIRQLTARDAAIYQDLRLRGLRDDPAAFSSSSAEEEGRSLSEVAARVTPAADGSLCVFGAFAGEQLAGIATFVRPAREKLRHRADLFGVYVAPELRRRGYGGALVDAVLAHARSLAGLRQLRLTVIGTNDAARALYRSRGFACVGVEPEAICVDGHYYDEELYVLRLTSVA